MSFLKDSSYYSSATIVSQFITFIRGMGVRLLLGPEALGIYNYVQVIVGFIGVIDLGANAAASRELPILHGRGDPKSERLYRGTIIWFNILQSFIIALGVLFYLFLEYATLSNIEVVGLFISPLLLLFSNLSASYIVILQSIQLFKTLSKINFILSVFEACSFLVGIYFFEVKGLLIALIFSSIIKLFLLIVASKKNKISTSFSMNLPILKRLLKFGVPLKLIDYPNRYMIMADLLWITKFMDTTSLAIYTTARLFFIQSTLISTSISTVFETRMVKIYGKDKSFKNIKKILKRFLFIQLLIVVPSVVIILSTIIPFFIRNVISKYESSSEIIIILLFSNFFYIVNSGLTIPWFIKKRLVKRGLANFVGFICMIICLSFFWFVLNMKNLNGVAFSIVAGSAAYFLFYVVAAGKDLWSNKDILKVIFFVLFSFFYCFLIVQIDFGETKHISLWLDIFHTIKHLLIKIILIIPMLIIGYYISGFKNLIKMIDN